MGEFDVTGEGSWRVADRGFEASEVRPEREWESCRGHGLQEMSVGERAQIFCMCAV